jgi:sulfide:quinone oxidoreductase
MEIKRLNETTSATGQITVDDLADIAQMGFRSIICNRPDDEDAGQPAFGQIEAAAKAAGLSAAYQPVVSGQVSEADGKAFSALMKTLPKPVLAYCRSGARSTMLHVLGGTTHDQVTSQSQ